jgi:hypothetical protein
MILLAEQTQFPVGQGGLHLTQWSFVDPASADRPKTPPASLVYDCGSKGGRGTFPRHLANMRRQLPLIRRERHLDILVLSHLHADHVDGFERLVGDEPLSIGTLILPHYDDVDWRILIALSAMETGDIASIVRMADIAADPQQWFRERGVQNIIAVQPSGEGGPPPPPIPDGPPEGYIEVGRELVADPDEVPRPEFRLYARASGTDSQGMRWVAPGAFLQIAKPTLPGASSSHTDWILVPYCQRHLGQYTHQQARQQFAADVDAIVTRNSSNGRLVVPPNRARAFLQDIKAAFKKYVPNKGDNWNVLSVSLFNGLGQTHQMIGWKSKLTDLTLAIDLALLEQAPWPWGGPDPMILGAFRSMLWRSGAGFPEDIKSHGWMMTGDTNLTGGAPAWRTFYSRLMNFVSVFQVPHHGSANNFDKYFPLSPDLLSFVTCKTNDEHHPDTDVKAAINGMHLHLLTVTYEPETMIQTLIAIDI